MQWHVTLKVSLMPYGTLRLFEMYVFNMQAPGCFAHDPKKCIVTVCRKLPVKEWNYR